MPTDSTRPRVSVIICTHNPRDNALQRTLGSLQQQTLSLDAWELLLVDNASTETLSEKWSLGWQPQSRHIREEDVGLTPARLRGIKESTGDVLLFVDDDNVLAENFLANVVEISTRYSFLGTFGAGVLKPEFEVQPPEELLPHLPLLALRTVSQPRWTNNISDYQSTPWGAGLCVRRSLAREYLKLVDQLRISAVLDRRGQQLFSGGDDMFSWVAAGAGFGFGIFPELQLTHLIAAPRVTKSYFLRLMKDHAFSHGVLHYLWEGCEPKNADGFALVRLLLHSLRHGGFSGRCQWAALKGQADARRFVTENGLKPVFCRA